MFSKLTSNFSQILQFTLSQTCADMTLVSSPRSSIYFIFFGGGDECQLSLHRLLSMDFFLSGRRKGEEEEEQEEERREEESGRWNEPV